MQLYQKETLTQLFSRNIWDIFLENLLLLKMFHSSFFLLNSFNPANIYLIKIAIETLEKGVKYIQSWQ